MHFDWEIFAGGTFEPTSLNAVEAGRTLMREFHNFPADVNAEGWPRLFKRLAAENRVHQLLFTQIRKPSIVISAEWCNVPMKKCHTSLLWRKYGYTGSACIPMALGDAIGLGKLKRGDLVAMIVSSFGYNHSVKAVRLTV